MEPDDKNENTVKRVLIGLAVAFGLALLVCCGGGFFIYERYQQALEQMEH